MIRRLPLGASALLWVGVMFLPGLPAYAWLWPNLRGTDWSHWAMVLVYVYFLACTLAIGLPRWSPDDLGLNRRGFGLSLVCGAAIIAFLFAGRFALALPFGPRPCDPWRLAGQFAFYFGQVGLVEELLFRSLIYRALLDWRGLRWALWGSALAFGAYHVGSQGPLAGLATAGAGLLFALIRWRSGGIVGLIFIHGAFDLLSVELWPELGPEALERVAVANRPLALVADVLLYGLVLYLWRPSALGRFWQRLTGGRFPEAPTT